LVHRKRVACSRRVVQILVGVRRFRASW
jgi:hypothetical protein